MTNRTIVLVSTVVLLVITGFVKPVSARSPAPGLSDPAELAAFMDGVIQAQLEAYNLAGATVAVVKDGALFFAKGYGYADLNQRKRVRADKTLFRVASISKLFVWTAVMQLVEQGKLDLSADINTYLHRFKIPDTYREPITLVHLMTHTAGFEEYVIGLFAKNTNRLLPTGDILARQLPARVRPPGDVASYSNHGTAIAAHIVEQVSGLSWNDYVEKNILRPLEMANTTFRQPVPERLLSNVSKGYSYHDGELHEEGFVYVPLAPIAAASTTAADMAKFMIAHLNLGQLGNARILESRTARQMHKALFRHAPEVNPMAYGFLDISRNGHWVIGHGGKIIYFDSKIALLPKQKVGLFVSFNTEGGEKAAVKTYELFMDRYYPPGEIRVLSPPEHSKDHLKRLTGRYFSNRRVHRRFTKLGALLGSVRVTLTEDNVLKTRGTKTTRWIEAKPLTFREVDGNRTLVFREDDRGRITHMFMGDLPIKAFERIRFEDSPILHIGLAAAVILLFFTTIFSWPFAAVIRWQHGVKMNPQMRIPRLAYLITWSACLLFTVVAVLLGVAFLDPNAVLFGVPIWIKVMLILTLFPAIMTVGSLFYTVAIWKSGKGSIGGRIYYTVVMLAFIATLWQLNHWNLLGFYY